jgi:hypothetical protein
MRIIYIPEKEIEKIKSTLAREGKFHLLVIAAEHGKYREGDFVKTAWGEKLHINKQVTLTDFAHFKKEYIHYPEIKESVNLDEIERLFRFKKIEILELRKYRS